ncbi:hypothetical protein ACRAWD_25375 [Caulobacter segnis]
MMLTDCGVSRRLSVQAGHRRGAGARAGDHHAFDHLAVRGVRVAVSAAPVSFAKARPEALARRQRGAGEQKGAEGREHA